jgi:multidrug efflux pump subunit AcrA (membrane-fusion protein)
MRSLTRIALPVLAAAGLGVGVFAATQARQTPPAATPLAQPASAPFSSYIGGSGQVEPPGQTVAVGAAVSGVAAEVPVRPGDQVAEGAVLFRLDDRVARAARDQKAADIAVQRAQIREAEVSLADATQQLRTAEAVPDRRAISAEDLAKRRNAMQLQEAKLATARAQLASVDSALGEAEAELARLTVVSPFAPPFCR